MKKFIIVSILGLIPLLVGQVALGGQDKIFWCHVEPNGNQQTLHLPPQALSGHRDAQGNPLHAGDHAGACEDTNANTNTSCNTNRNSNQNQNLNVNTNVNQNTNTAVNTNTPTDSNTNAPTPSLVSTPTDTNTPSTDTVAVVAPQEKVTVEQPERSRIVEGAFTALPNTGAKWPWFLAGFILLAIGGLYVWDIVGTEIEKRNQPN